MINRKNVNINYIKKNKENDLLKVLSWIKLKEKLICLKKTDLSRKKIIIVSDAMGKKRMKNFIIMYKINNIALYKIYN